MDLNREELIKNIQILCDSIKEKITTPEPWSYVIDNDIKHVVWFWKELGSSISNRRKTPWQRTSIPSKTRKKVYERDKYRCSVCKSYIDLQVDHIKPVATGGSNDIGNLRAICKKCNCKKGTKRSYLK